MSGIAPLSSIFVYGASNVAGMSTLDSIIQTQHTVETQVYHSFEQARADAHRTAAEQRLTESTSGGQTPGGSGMIDKLVV